MRCRHLLSLKSMGHHALIVTLFTVTMLLASACIPENRVDRTKFAELNRTMQDLRSAISSSAPCDVPETLVQQLAAGITTVKDKASSQAEREVVAAYSNLLITYRDGRLLCWSRTHLTQFQFVPRGRIYVTQEIDPIVERYDLSTQKHVYRPTGEVWKSIDSNSFMIVWQSAKAQTQNIEFMVEHN